MRDAWEVLKDGLLIAWLTLLELGEWLHEQTAEHNWLSWIFHGLIAIPVAILGGFLYLVGLFVGWPGVVSAGLSAAVSFYLWRELEQIAHRVMAGTDLDPLDHVLDVLAPLGFVLLAWWVS